MITICQHGQAVIQTATIHRPKLWTIKNKRLVLGTGPFKTYRRLMGTQYGIIFRQDSDDPVIIAIATTSREVDAILADLKQRLVISDLNRLGVKRHEAHPPLLRTRVAKTHKIRKRKHSFSKLHQNWYKLSPGFPIRLAPPFDKGFAEITKLLSQQ